MTDKTDIPALKRPVRDRYDWSSAVWRDCDQCGKQHTGTVTAEDGSQICSHCADQLYWSAWQVLAERSLERLETERQQREAFESAAFALRDEMRNQQKRAVLAEKERDALKSAHGNMVTRCALLRQRTDLPVDRIPAYNSLVKAQEENAALKAKLANPVVLPAGYAARAGHPFHEGERNVMIPNKHCDWLSRFEVEHAIHVAGFPFTVKGE